MPQLVIPPRKATDTIAIGASTSLGWSVPEGVTTMTLIVPALEANSFWRLQTLASIAADGTQTWVETYMQNQSSVVAVLTQLGDGVAQFTQAPAAVAFPYNQYGAGPLRIKTAVNQTALRTFTIFFDKA